jgi:hypothetical protein
MRGVAGYLACEMAKRRPLRRQRDDHNFGSPIMLAVTAGAFLVVAWGAMKRFFPLQ